MDLINPQTEEQEAENAAYIARECERIRSTWTEGDTPHCRGNVEPRNAAHYLRIRSRALRELQQRMKPL